MSITGAPDDRSRSIEAVRALARASRVLERSSGELNLAQYRVLSAVASGQERASRIAAHLAVGKPTISASVEALCQRGLLSRVEVDGDLRAVSLQLTAAGQSLLDEVETEMAARVEDLARRTPDGEAVMDCLVWLSAAIDELLNARVTAR